MDAGTIVLIGVVAMYLGISFYRNSQSGLAILLFVVGFLAVAYAGATKDFVRESRHGQTF